MTEIVLTSEIVCFILWILLFYFWFSSENDDMTALLAVIFVPYDIFFVWQVLPKLGIGHWLVSAIFVGIALAVLGFTIEMKRKEKK